MFVCVFLCVCVRKEVAVTFVECDHGCLLSLEGIASCNASTCCFLHFSILSRFSECL